MLGEIQTRYELLHRKGLHLFGDLSYAMANKIWKIHPVTKILIRRSILWDVDDTVFKERASASGLKDNYGDDVFRNDLYILLMQGLIRCPVYALNRRRLVASLILLFDGD